MSTMESPKIVSMLRKRENSGPRIQASLLSHPAAADFIEQYLLFVLTLRA